MCPSPGCGRSARSVMVTLDGSSCAPRPATPAVPRPSPWRAPVAGALFSAQSSQGHLRSLPRRRDPRLGVTNGGPARRRSRWRGARLCWPWPWRPGARCCLRERLGAGHRGAPVRRPICPGRCRGPSSWLPAYRVCGSTSAPAAPHRRDRPSLPGDMVAALPEAEHHLVVAGQLVARARRAPVDAPVRSRWSRPSRAPEPGASTTSGPSCASPPHPAVAPDLLVMHQSKSGAIGRTATLLCGLYSSPVHVVPPRRSGPTLPGGPRPSTGP